MYSCIYRVSAALKQELHHTAGGWVYRHIKIYHVTTVLQLRVAACNLRTGPTANGTGVRGVCHCAGVEQQAFAISDPRC